MSRLPIYFFVFLALSTILPTAALAQTAAVMDRESFEKARVLNASNQHASTIPGTRTPSTEQTLLVEVLDGPDKGATTTIINNYTQLSTGDLFYVRHTVNELDNVDFWSVADPYRLNTLALLLCVFIVLICLFGGMQGVRGLASLVGSIALIFYLLIPGVLHGYSPILVSTGVASFIIIVGSYVTHGFNRTTTAAVVGMLGTVLVTGLSAYYFIHASRLSGFTSEDVVYLNLDAKGTIDTVGLLFGGIMIGLLGILYDIAIGQAIAVEELFRAGTHLTRVEVYKRAIRIGREHIGALVNTLAIAYVGASLPLLLLIQSSTTGLPFMLNSEIFATEFIRILIGSIGLVLAVPITTILVSFMLEGRVSPGPSTHTHHH